MLPQTPTRELQQHFCSSDMTDSCNFAARLFAKIKQELKKAEQLKKFGLTSSDSERVMSLAFTKRPVVIDIREPGSENEIALFINNIETDAAFAHWPDSIHAVSGLSVFPTDDCLITSFVLQLLQPTMPGQFRFVRKNVFTCVLLVDPSKQPDLVALDTLTSMLDRGLPIRLGVILLTHPAPASEGRHMSESVGKAFWHVKKTISMKSAISFLGKVRSLFSCSIIMTCYTSSYCGRA